MILEARSKKEKIITDLKDQVTNLTLKPKLVVIQVGDNPASNTYIRNKSKMCEKVGYTFELKKYPETITQDKLLEDINNLNLDNSVNAILVQMPLPKHLDELLIQNSINPIKDVDGLTDLNMGKLSHNKDTLYPCTAIGIIELLDHYNLPITGKHVVIVGRSNLVGKPVASLFLNRNATITHCHSYTKNLKDLTKEADILVVAAGIPNLITKDMVKENSIIIDVGINKVGDTLTGDVDFNSIKDKVQAITPVPGGVGQMTVAELAKNILKAYNYQQNK